MSSKGSGETMNLRRLVGAFAIRIGDIRGSRKYCQRGSNSDFGIFLADERREDQNTTKSWSSLARQRNAI